MMINESKAVTKAREAFPHLTRAEQLIKDLPLLGEMGNNSGQKATLNRRKKQMFYMIVSEPYTYATFVKLKQHLQDYYQFLEVATNNKYDDTENKAILTELLTKPFPSEKTLSANKKSLRAALRNTLYHIEGLPKVTQQKLTSALGVSFMSMRTASDYERASVVLTATLEEMMLIQPGNEAALSAALVTLPLNYVIRLTNFPLKQSLAAIDACKKGLAIINEIQFLKGNGPSVHSIKLAAKEAKAVESSQHVSGQLSDSNASNEASAEPSVDDWDLGGEQKVQHHARSSQSQAEAGASVAPWRLRGEPDSRFTLNNRSSLFDSGERSAHSEVSAVGGEERACSQIQAINNFRT